MGSSNVGRQRRYLRYTETSDQADDCATSKVNLPNFEFPRTNSAQQIGLFSSSPLKSQGFFLQLHHLAVGSISGLLLESDSNMQISGSIA